MLSKGPRLADQPPKKQVQLLSWFKLHMNYYQPKLPLSIWAAISHGIGLCSLLRTNSEPTLSCFQLTPMGL